MLIGIDRAHDLLEALWRLFFSPHPRRAVARDIPARAAGATAANK